MKVLEIKNIKKSFENSGKTFDILKGISFDVEENDFISIIGSSGSGKSTLLSIIAGLDKPTSGVIKLNSKDITHLSEDELSQIRNLDIGFIFQSFFLVPSLTAYENVILPGEIKGDFSKKKAEDIMKKVGIFHRKDNYPIQLSGGEKQRVAIARALINNPKILFADEPTGNLDSKNSKNIMDLFLELKKELGLTLIVVTHEKEVSKIASRVIEISDGKIVADKRNKKWRHLKKS